MRVCIPTALPGIITGAMLAVARAMGETAPLLLTALGNDLFTEYNPAKRMSTLSLQIFDNAVTGFQEGQARAWAGALTLIAIVLIFTFDCSLLRPPSSHIECLTWPLNLLPRRRSRTTTLTTPGAIGRRAVDREAQRLVRQASCRRRRGPGGAGASVTALIGPSGCGKSTLLRCVNRMHEIVPGARVEGRVMFGGQNIYDPDIDPGSVRSEIGMVFQRPNPFPTKSIFENAIIGVRLAKSAGDRKLDDIAESALRRAQLWDEVKDRLNKPAVSLSGGQQQRLCIARAVAVDPALLLMDEPCSALDPIATFKIEELIREIADQYTVIIVTHNMQQATRVSQLHRAS